MPTIHPLSYVDPKAEVASGVLVGPFCNIEAGASIAEGCILESHVTVHKWTTVGKNNRFGPGTVIGGDPQDRKYNGEPTFLQIGENNIFREYVTIHRATGEGKSTVIGNDIFIMAYCHVGHNCNIQDKVTIANSAGIAGHVTIEEMGTIGGMVGIHQFCRIGRSAMVGGFTKITRDVPPFCLVDGAEEAVRDINAVGLRRLGIGQDSRLALHKAVKILFKSKLGLSNAMELVREEVPMTEEIKYMLAFEERRFHGRNGRGDQH